MNPFDPWYELPFHNNDCGVWRTDPCNCWFGKPMTAEQVAQAAAQERLAAEKAKRAAA